MSLDGVNKKMIVLLNKRTLEPESTVLEAGLLGKKLTFHFELTTEPAEQWDLKELQIYVA